MKPLNYLKETLLLNILFACAHFAHTSAFLKYLFHKLEETLPGV